jgi:hypothetical protein
MLQQWGQLWAAGGKPGNKDIGTVLDVPAGRVRIRDFIQQGFESNAISQLISSRLGGFQMTIANPDHLVHPIRISSKGIARRLTAIAFLKTSHEET